MDHLAKVVDIQMRPNSAHFLALSEDRNDEVEVLDQGMTSYQSTEDMCETISLGDKSTYPVEEFGQASIKLELGNHVHLSNVLYVPGLEKNFVSISCLEDKGNRIAFMDGKVLSWHKNSSIEDARVIGSREGNLYRLLEQNEEALVHESTLMNFGIEGTLISIIKHYLSSEKWLKEYQN
jgi:hypothetical protein